MRNMPDNTNTYVFIVGLIIGIIVLNKSVPPALAVLLKLRFGRNHHPVWQENILHIGGTGHPDLWPQPYGARHRPVLGSARRGGDRL